MKKLPILIDLSSEYNPVRSWKDVNPFTTVHIYARDPKKSRFLVGGWNDIKPHYKQWLRNCGSCICHINYHYHGFRRTRYEIENIPYGRPCIQSNRKRRLWHTKRRFSLYSSYRSIMTRDNDDSNLIRHMRRIPKGWIKELDQFVIPQTTLHLNSKTRNLWERIHDLLHSHNIRYHTMERTIYGCRFLFYDHKWNVTVVEIEDSMNFIKNIFSPYKEEI